MAYSVENFGDAGCDARFPGDAAGVAGDLRSGFVRGELPHSRDWNPDDVGGEPGWDPGNDSEAGDASCGDRAGHRAGGVRGGVSIDVGDALWRKSIRSGHVWWGRDFSGWSGFGG